jgi:hypothetical protein
MNRSALIGFALLLTSCSHSLDCSMGYWHDDCEPGSRAYEEKQKADAAAAAANETADDTQCKSYGFAPGTPAYVRCRDQLEEQREHTADGARASLAGRLLGQHPF